jgi:hypothetical protein
MDSPPPDQQGSKTLYDEIVHDPASAAKSSIRRRKTTEKDGAQEDTVSEIKRHKATQAVFVSRSAE